MRSILFTILVIAFTQVLNADQLICTQPGNTVTIDGSGTCALTGPAFVSNKRVMSFVYNTVFDAGVDPNGTYSALYIAELLSIPNNIQIGSFPMTATATWNDSFSLPSSKPTDILKISVLIDGLAGTPDVRIGPTPSLNYTAGCDFYFDQNCRTTNTVSAAGIRFLDISGIQEFTFDYEDQGSFPSANRTDLAIDVLIQRFLADGTTPDPFTTTPEPSGLGVTAGFSGVLLGFWKLRRSARRAKQ